MKILDTKAWVASLACSALAGGAPAPLIRLTPDLAPGLLLCVLLGLLASWGSGPFPAFLVGLCRAREGGQGQTPALRARPRAEGGRSPCARPVLCSQGRCCVVPDPTRIPPGSRHAVCVCAAVGSSCVVCSLGRCALWPPSLPSCWYPPRVFPGGPARDLTWRTIPMPAGRTGPAVAGRGVLRRQWRPGRPWCRAGPRPY